MSMSLFHKASLKSQYPALKPRSASFADFQRTQSPERRFSLGNVINRKCRNFKKSFIQRILPAQFSTDSTTDQVVTVTTDPTLIRLNVYTINDNLGFYHTGLVFNNREFTFCQDIGICHHEPKRVDFATFLGSIKLGYSKITEKTFSDLLDDMTANGFSVKDYDVMERSCNTFTADLATRLGLRDRYPLAVLNQSKLGGLLSPLARALNLIPGEGQLSGGSVSNFLHPSNNRVQEARRKTSV